jgi:hypothetical protein
MVIVIEIPVSGTWLLYSDSGQWDVVIVLIFWAVGHGYCFEIPGSGTWLLF